MGKGLVVAEGKTRPYLARTRRECTLVIHAATFEDAERIALNTPAAEWTEGKLENVEIEED